MTDLPAPPIGPEVDLRDFDFMPLHGERLFTSDTWITCNPEEKVAALRLWWASWHQEPAGSLPKNENLLADLAGYGVAVKAFRKVSENALRGWIECSDGRLYHPVVVEIALESWAGKKKRDRDREVDRLRKATKRAKRPADTGGNSGGTDKKSRRNPSEKALKGREGKKKEREVKDSVFDQHSRYLATSSPRSKAATREIPKIAHSADHRPEETNDLDSGGSGSGNGRFSDQDHRDAWAQNRLVDLVGWPVLQAAENPVDPDHAKAVMLCLKAAREHGIGWISPEERSRRRFAPQSGGAAG